MIKIVLLTLGVLLCPAYYIYITFFTGQAIHSLPLAPAQEGFQSVSFSVEPKSDPIRIVLQISTEHNPLVQTTPPMLRYLVTVTQASGASKSYNVQLNSQLATDSERRDFNEAIVTLPVATADNITVSVKQTEPSQMNVTNAKLIVSARVLSANMSVVWTGAALLAAAVLMLFGA